LDTLLNNYLGIAPLIATVVYPGAHASTKTLLASTGKTIT